MVFDITPRSYWTLPAIRSMWENDDDMMSFPLSQQNGLSVSEDAKKYYVEASVPGINPDDVEVEFQDGYVWIHGEANDEVKDRDRKYYRQLTRSFSYRVAVPGDTDASVEPEATYKNGVMTVSFAKSPKTLPKKIKVRK